MDFAKAVRIYEILRTVTCQGSTDSLEKVNDIKDTARKLFIAYTSSRDATIIALSEALQKSKGLQNIKDSIS